jgi:probable rRNA maturation factor
MIRGEELRRPAWASRAAGFCKKVLRKLHLDNFELSVVFCNNNFIRSLNRRFRGKDEPTDILSFSQEEGAVLPEKAGGARVIGDMVISLDMLTANGRDFSVPEEEELKRLLVHGILHLAGKDHAGPGPEEPMLILQEEILQELSEEKIF